MHENGYGKNISRFSSSYDLEQHSDMKKNKNRQRSKSFTNSRTEYYQKPNENYFIRDKQGQYGNTSYSSNNFSETSFGIISCWKNKKKISRNINFVGSRSSINHEQGSHNRKRRFSDRSVDFFMNKKSKCNGSIKKTYINSPEGEQLNISNDTPDSELFFFDISGNSHSSYGEALSASFHESLTGKTIKPASRDSNNKNTKFNGSVEAPGKQINFSVTDNFENRGKLKKKKIKPTENRIKIRLVESATKEKLAIDENLSNQNDEFILEKLRKLEKSLIADKEISGKNNNQEMSNNHKKNKKKKLIGNEEMEESTPQNDKNGDSFINDVLDDDSEANNQTTCFKSPKKSKEKNNTLTDLRNSDLEMSFGDTSFHKKKKRERHWPNSDNDIEYDAGKKIKERINIDSLIDIRDSDCEMSYTDASYRKEKKTKKQQESPNNDKKINEEQDNDATDALVSLKKSKKYKKVEALVDIRDSDCEMSVEDISNCKRKKKEVEGTAQENLLDNLYSSLKSRKKSKKKKISIEPEISKIEENTESIHQMKIIDNFNNSVEYDEGQEVNKETSNGKSPKKSKKKNTLVDLRDSDYEMTFTGGSYPKKKKKGKKHRESPKNDIKHDDNKKINEEQDNDATSALVSLKKSKKHKKVEALVDIRDSDCEMSVEDISNCKRKKKELEGTAQENLLDNLYSSLKSRKKSKKKKISIEPEIPKIEENTESIHQMKIIDNFNNSVEHDEGQEVNEEKNNGKSPKKLKKKNQEKNTLVDLRESDCEMTFTDGSYHKKNKKGKKHRESPNNDIEHDDNKTINEEQHNDARNAMVSLKKSKKHKKIEALVDIGDSDCEMSVEDISNRKREEKEEEVEKRIAQEKNVDNLYSSLKSRKKSKKKKISIEPEIPMIEENTESTHQMKIIDDFINIVEHEVQEANKETSNGKSPKKSKKKNREKNTTLVDLRSSDCEMTFTDGSYHKKKKGKKHRENPNDIKHDDDYKKNEKQDNDATNTMVTLKKSKKQKIGALVDIRDSDCEMSVEDIPNCKRENKEEEVEEKIAQEKNVDNLFIDNFNNSVEDDEVQEATSNEKSVKKSKKENREKNTLVDLRDSDCEMSFTDGSYLRKKKKGKKHRESPNNDIKHDDDNNEEQDDATNTMMSLKKSKKHKKIEALVDIRDSDCEMSAEDISYHERKKTSVEVGENTQQLDSSSIADVDIMLDDNSKKSKKAKVEVKVDTNNSDFINNLSLNGHTSQSRFPENSIGNLSDHKEVTNSSMQNVDNTENNAFTSVAYNNDSRGFYSMIYTSSSEGYQSDSSELTIPTKNRRRPSVKDEKLANCTGESDKSDSIFIKGNGPGVIEEGQQEDVFDVSYGINSSDEERTEECIREEDVSPETSKPQSKFEREFVGEKSTRDESLMEISNASKDVSDDDIETVFELEITCSFPVPELHSIVTRTSGPTKEQLEIIKELNLEVKTGLFSKEEDKTIVNNWNSFCKEYNLTVNPSLFISFPRRMKRDNKLKFLRHLACGLNNRMLHRVHARFKNLLDKLCFKTGRFTKEEDKTIVDYIEEYESRTHLRDLSELLNRSKQSIQKRYLLLMKVKNNTRVKWTPEIVARFISCMTKITKCDKVQQLKHRKFTAKEWNKLSKKMDNIPVKKLQRGWHVTIYPKLFSKDVDVKAIKTIKEDVIHKLYARRETDWKTVDWKEIAKDCKGFTPEKIYTMVKNIVYYHVPEKLRENLKDCVDYLENQVLKDGKLSTAHKFKKFVFKDGQVVVKDEIKSA